MSYAQDTINVFEGPVMYSNLDTLQIDTFSDIDISLCKSISYGFSYQFSLPWEGPANMETPDECGSTDPCPGDTDSPFNDDCLLCWDFMRVELFVDDIKKAEEIIGDVGTTDAEQSGRFFSDIICTSNHSSAEIKVSNLNWASTETNLYSDVVLICYLEDCELSDTEEIKNEIDIYPNPIFSFAKLAWDHDTAIKPSVRLYDLTGNKVLSQNLLIIQNEIDLTDLQSGVYIIEILDENKVLATKKILKI